MHHVSRTTAQPMPHQSGPVAYIDIETTGLSPQYSHITLIGLVMTTPAGHRNLQQFFATTPEDEPHIIAAAAACLTPATTLFTFNGQRFDLPFLAARAAQYYISWPHLPHVDLLPVAQQWNAERRVLPNCKLQTLMAHFRLGRIDTTSGAEMVSAYYRWLESGHPDDRDLILAHNAEDLLLLPDLAHRLSADSDHEAG